MAARFRIGDRVRIDERKERHHHRVPAYAKGCAGVIERACRAYDRPELLNSRERSKRATTVYRVRMLQRHIWSDYDGDPADTLDIEIFEHWLQPALQAEDTGGKGGGDAP